MQFPRPAILVAGRAGERALIVAGELANGVVEPTSHRIGTSEEMSPEAAVDRIAQIYAGR